MELRTYWRIIKRRWWLAVLPALVVVAHTWITFEKPPTLYQAHVNFTAGLPPEFKADDYTYDGYYAWLTSEFIANGLADVVRRERFAAAVSARLDAQGIKMPDGAPIPSGAIQGAIASDNVQSLFVIYVTWGDPDTLLAMTAAVASELTEHAGHYFPQLQDVPVAPVRQVDAPVPAAQPPSLRAQLTGPAVRVALGLTVGLALVFLLHYLDPTLHDRTELEGMGYEVLGEIPRRSRWQWRR